jgi:hypothetical protein
MMADEVVQRRLLRGSAWVLVQVLDEHRGLPVLTWTVTPRALIGHAELCEVDAGPGREVFTAWAQALPVAEGGDPVPVLDDGGVTRLRAVRRVNGVPVVLTAAVHPF